MLYIAWGVLIFTIVQMLTAIVNLLFISKLTNGKLSARPLVSVLIPARNEEMNIANILNDIIQQDFNEIEVIVFNDNSTDHTAAIVKGFALKDKRINLIDSKSLPSGWLGKNWACHTLAGNATGEYFLFLDADVRIGKGLIMNSIGYLKRFNLSMISIFPKQIIKTTGEKITVPVMNYILLSLLPLVMVRKSVFSSLSAANGQFMLFDAGAYKSMLPHEKMRNNKVEDIEIARYFKKKKYRIACLAGDDSIQCRMYNGFMEAINGFSKNVTAFFGNSIFLALLFWVITTFGFLFVLIALPVSYFVVYLTAYLLTRIIISLVSGQDVKDNLLYLIPQQLSMGLFIFFAFINKTMRTYQWKGRDIN
jgi:glycosyltransferase involved in cell wall biosynthesis